MERERTGKSTGEPTRQIHLDFHTSEHLPDIGKGFDERQFVDVLRRGRVNLINLFAKCHHGWSYYPTQVGRPHPNLATDLLGRQIEACHSAAIRAPIYFTVGWSAADAEDHPDWCMRDAEGRILGGWDESVSPHTPKPTFQWKSLCPSGEYHDLIMRQTEEICRRYPVDGMWYDIYQPHNLCWCSRCREGMREAGVDPEDLEAVEHYRAETIRRHCRAVGELIRSHHSDASVYFNGLTTVESPLSTIASPQNFRYRLFEFNTKNDLEDLPTTWGGYDKFPLRAKLFHRESKPIVAMSGKFHTSWGEFGGFKAPDALRFEAAAMISYGARCNFGDHLHPHGGLEPSTYENIGYAYEYVERIEEFGIDGGPAATLGFVPSFVPQADEGAVRMLLEEQLDFDVLRPGDDLSRFQAIVIPSSRGVLAPFGSEIERYLEAGGRALTLGEGILDADGRTPALPCGAAYAGPGRFDSDFTVLLDATGAARPRMWPDGGDFGSAVGPPDGLPSTPFLNYEPALRFTLDSGTRVLAGVHEPYFSRTYGAYCGHQNSPYRLDRAEHPAVFDGGNVVVMAHPLDRMYYAHGAVVHRLLFAAALRSIHRTPMVDVDIASAGRVSLLHQADRGRYVAHLLYGAPLARGNCLVIEDQPMMREVGLSLSLPVDVKRLVLQPEGRELSFNVSPVAQSVAGISRTINTVVPEFKCHCAVVAEY